MPFFAFALGNSINLPVILKTRFVGIFLYVLLIIVTGLISY
ncbi:MAG: 2-keto-3-deoxygluconate permease [Candidatus Malihini olakiniferum]